MGSRLDPLGDSFPQNELHVDRRVEEFVGAGLCESEEFPFHPGSLELVGRGDDDGARRLERAGKVAEPGVEIGLSGPRSDLLQEQRHRLAAGAWRTTPGKS